MNNMYMSQYLFENIFFKGPQKFQVGSGSSLDCKWLAARIRFFNQDYIPYPLIIHNTVNTKVTLMLRILEYRAAII